MKQIVADFETYYTPDYSLTKMQTDAYVLDPRFEVIGVSVKVDDGPIQWHSGTDLETAGWLHQFPWEDSAVICHNTLFDGFILAQRFGIKPKLWMDTLGMARMLYPYLASHSLLNLSKHFKLQQKGDYVSKMIGRWREDISPTELAAYGQYCQHDVQLTYDLAQMFMPKVPLLELKLIDMTIRMFTEPAFVGDAALMEQLYNEEITRKATLLASAAVDKTVLMSNEKMADALRALYVEPPQKLSARTGKLSYAFAKTDKAFIALLEHDDPQVQALVGARLGVKTTIAETRAKMFWDMSLRGPLPVYLNYWGAKTTGRYSGGNRSNWQNLSARGPSAGLRKAIRAPEGHKVLVGDSSNIELRVAMAAAGQHDVLQLISAGEDLYCNFASKMFGRTITKADKKERMLGKIAMLSLQYGAGWRKFQEMVRIETTKAGTPEPISDQTAEDVVGLYRRVHHDVVSMWKQFEDIILPEIHNGNSNLMPVDVNAWVLCTGEGYGVGGGPGVVYHKLKQEPDKDMYGRPTLQWVYSMGREKVKVYGGKCVDGNALVLTEFGWRPLNQLGSERVHDGVEFVQHGGKVLKGIQECVPVDGVYMTPTHKVLTNEGWLPALEKPEPYRPTIRNAHCDTAEPLGRQENALAFSVYLRDTVCEGWYRSDEGSEARRNAELWLRNQGAYERGDAWAWDESPPCLCRMAEYVRQMQAAFASGMEKLRGAWDNSVQRVGNGLLSILARHGGELSPWAYLGSSGQREGVQYLKLRMEDMEVTSTQQAEQHGRGYANPVRANRHTEVDTVLPVGAGASTREVWDIVNCGPRQRFVVLGAEGPFIVHNCFENYCQHVARQIVMWQTARINQRYPVALSVHDEAVCVVRDEELEEARAYMTECLSLAPPWCRGAIPLACETGVGDSYGTAEH